MVGALLLLFVPGENKNAIRWIANIFALAGLLVSIPLVPMFWAQRFQPGFKFLEGTANNWIPSIGAGYNLGIDGIAVLPPGPLTLAEAMAQAAQLTSETTERALRIFKVGSLTNN